MEFYVKPVSRESACYDMCLPFLFCEKSLSGRSIFINGFDFAELFEYLAQEWQGFRSVKLSAQLYQLSMIPRSRFCDLSTVYHEYLIFQEHIYSGLVFLP